MRRSPVVQTALVGDDRFHDYRTHTTDPELPFPRKKSGPSASDFTGLRGVLEAR